ncbi:MAG: hypothetical protein JEY96_05715 [Bacteroidales bacterium]|nr:hypothetical protein [Bacteroidales bacterium]
MEAFEIYLLKSTSLLSMLYIAYWFTIRNGSYYSWNRVFLLLSLVISFLLPTLNFFPQNIASNSYSFILEPLVVNPNYIPAKSINTSNALSILTIIYIGGATYFCLRFLSNIARIYFLYFRFPKYKFNEFKAVILDNDQAAFTFFNLLFISRSDYESGNTDEIIVHEKAHRDEYHSFDIILLEVMTIIQWFNPFVWLFRLSLKSEHEFIADNKVLKEGFDKLEYQKLLFEKTLGITTLNLTNNFNYSLLKKRLKMMTKKTNSIIKLKYLLSMPTMLLIMILFAVNLNSYGQDEIYTEVDTMAQYNDGGIAGMRKFAQQNVFYPKSAIKDNISAIIYVQFDIDDKGNVTNVKINRSDIRNNEIEKVMVTTLKPKTSSETTTKSLAVLEAEAIRLINLLNGFTPALKDGRNVKSQYTFPIHFQITETEG